MGTLLEWIEKHKPAEIAMNDSQYSWFASMSKKCLRDVNGIPIVFSDTLLR
jgi:hypothetical protein